MLLVECRELAIDNAGNEHDKTRHLQRLNLFKRPPKWDMHPCVER